MATLVYLAILMVNPTSATADSNTETQSGYVSMAASQVNVTINSVNTSAAYVISSSRAAISPDGALIRVMSVLLNDTTIGLYRFEATTNVTNVAWQIVEDPDLVVQRGTFSYTTELNVNASITAVNLSNSFVINSVRSNNGNNLNLRGFWRSKFVNTTRISNTRGSGVSGGDVAWQVITWNGANIKNGSVSLGVTNVTSVSFNAINNSNTFLTFSYDCSTNGVSICFVKGYFLNSTTARFERVNNTAGTNVIDYFLVSESTINVENGTTTLDGITNTNATTRLVNLSREFVVNSWASNQITTTYQRAFTTYRQINSTIIEFIKGTASEGTFHAWYSIVFQDAAPTDDCAYTTGNYNLPCGCNVSTNTILSPAISMQNLSINGTGTTVITANITNVANVNIFGLSSANQCNVILANGARII